MMNSKLLHKRRCLLGLWLGKKKRMEQCNAVDKKLEYILTATSYTAMTLANRCLTEVGHQGATKLVDC